MKKWLLLALSACCTAAAYAQETIDSALVTSHYVKKEVMIPMRDGVKLFTSIYLPTDQTEKHPILMTRTPYSCAPYGANKFKAFWNVSNKNFLRENYILITQDVRGRWMSEGQYEDVRPFNPHKKTPQDIDEASDTYDTIDWLVKNLEGNNGRVGIFGISYPGFYSTMAALSGHPALKAVSPQAPVTDWFMGDDFHHHGAFFQMDAFDFYTSFGAPRPRPTTVGPEGFRYYTRDNYKFYMDAGSLPGLTRLMGDTIAFWKDLMNHGTYDAWWKARNVRPYLNTVKPAMLEVGGVFDAEDCFGAWNVYKSIEQQTKGANNKIVMGPWYHGEWAAADGTHLGHVRWGSNTATFYQDSLESVFFNYYLKDKGSDNLSEATVFFSGENQWKHLPQWPPAGMQETPIYLQAGNKLSFTKPASTNSFSEYTSDPAKPVPYVPEVHMTRTISYMTDDQRFAERRPDVLSFETDVLTNNVTLAGPVVADLVASVSSTDADFVVKVIDVFPDDFQYGPDAPTEHRRLISGTYPMGGYEMLVRGDIMRGKFRNSYEKPEAFVPYQPASVKFTLPDVAHTFLKGHRIMIQVQSSWFPLVDR
ncbi:MAG TPA: CocE/NonD family hydrolase, partial [Chitinophaga sp.]